MNILHLSDIHFGRNYECYNIKDNFKLKEKILIELIKCVNNIDKQMKPEHIVVTGDIAWHGKRKEYEEALSWFKNLLFVAGLSGKDITFCVGNHDVNRNYATIHSELNDNAIAEIDEIYKYSHVHEMEPPIYDYDKFCEEIGMEPFAYPVDGKMEYSYSLGYKDVSFSSGNKIRLVAFNTALLSSIQEISDDRMWIGLNQVKELMRYGVIPAHDNVHYTIALFHHAERFLHPNEVCEYDGRVATLPLLRQNVDLVLCGHTETGGRPVLQQQIGGGKLLTAGATYYNDDHPNSFSMLYVPDNSKDVIIAPYTYNSGWKRYEMEISRAEKTEIQELPSVSEIEEACRFVVKSDNQEYQILLKKLSVFAYDNNGQQYIRLNNRKEVLRELNIEYEGPIAGGKTDVRVFLAPKMERSISAMLQREKYFKFLSNTISSKDTEFYIENSVGTKVLSGSSLTGNAKVDEISLKILSDIARIEDFYDLKFYRPDDIYEIDIHQIQLIIQLIDEGFTDAFSLGKLMTTEFKDKDALKKLCEKAHQTNAFCLCYENDFKCELFGVQFNLGKILIIAGKYHVDIDDLLYKMETFKEGDSRLGVFNSDSDFHTYFICNKELAREKILMEPEYEIFTAGKLNLKFGFIYEA